MSAGIADVAARAGVSVATVSRALRGLPNVAESTRRRVLDAADELRYVAHPHAARLAAGRSQTIGVVVPLFTRWFFAQVVAGAESVLTPACFDLLLYSVGSVQRRARFLDTMPFRKRVDGIVFVDLPLDDTEQAALAEQGVPVAAVGQRTRHFASVTIDNVAAAATATRHLTNLGHTRVGLISGQADDPLRVTAPLERREGYRRALGEQALEVRPELDVPGSFSFQGGAEAMARLLRADPPPTAVIAESDEMAIGALKTAGDASLRVPEDLSIVGFDGHDMAEFTGLTTIAQPVAEQGEIAATLLLELLNDPPDGDPPQVVLPTKLVLRSTTGPPPTRRTSRAVARPRL